MKPLTLSILTFCFINLSTGNYSFCQGNHVTNPEFTNLKNKKAYTDKYIEQHSKNLIVLVKLTGKKTLERVWGDKWPDDIEYTFNILKAPSVKIIFISQMFDSESGDWS